MEKKGKFDGRSEKKEKNLHSILDKLRHSVSDAGPSVIVTHKSRENDDIIESSSTRAVDDESIEKASNEVGTSEGPMSVDVPFEEDSTGDSVASKSIEAIVIDDDDVQIMDSDTLENNENEMNIDSFIKMSSEVVEEDSKKTSDDSVTVLIVDDDINTPSGSTPDCDTVKHNTSETSPKNIPSDPSRIQHDSSTSVQSLENGNSVPQNSSSTSVALSSATAEDTQKETGRKVSFDSDTTASRTAVDDFDQLQGDSDYQRSLKQKYDTLAYSDENRISIDAFDLANSERAEVDTLSSQEGKSIEADATDFPDVKADSPITVVPLDDEDQLEIDSVIGEDGERLLTVRKREETKIENAEQENREQLPDSENLISDVLPPFVACTACGKKIKILSQKVLQHPVLSVLVCKNCNKFYNSSSFRRDKYGMEEFCKWCGDGGDLICCDFCEKVYCQRCVKRNMGENFLKILLEADDEKWKCFCCDPSQIDSFSEECSVIMKLLKRQKMRGYAFESKKTHLGGPSQFERKERLKNISHVLEDKVTGAGDVVKVEIDPDFDLPAQELLKCDINDEDGRVSSKTKRKVHTEHIINSEELTKDDDMPSMGRKIKLNRTDGNPEKYLLRKCRVVLERVEIPVNCIVPTVSHDKPRGASQRGMEEINLISDGDSEPDVSKGKESVKMLSKDGRKVRLGKRFANVDGTTLEVNDVDLDSDEEGSELQSGEEDESYDIEEASDFEIKEESQDLPTLEDSEELITNEESSDSDYDYQRFRRKSIRRNMHNEKGNVFENLENENLDNNEDVSGDNDNDDVDDDDDDDDKQDDKKHSSSDESLLSKRKGKRRKETKKKGRQSAQSESDSDVLSRMKKRPRRKRRGSSYSSGSSNEGKATDESEEENYRKDGRKNRKKQGKKQGRGKKMRRKGKTRGKKRRMLMTDSNESSDDEKSPSKNKGRKNIRRILGEEELGEETRKARHLEEERRRRLLERTQATYIEEQARRKPDMAGRTILEMDKKEGIALVEVHDSLVSNLKPHQVEGIQFMYDCLFESVEKFKNGDKGNGALLAHCMGLGKSLQIIALLHAVANNVHIGLTRFLIVAPLNTVYNWQNEFEKWLEVDQRMDVYVLTDSGSNLKLRMSMLKDWHHHGGVMILGYDMYRNLTQFKRIKSKKHKKTITETLLDPGPDIVVCDEGHILRNDLSAISKALTKIRTLRRVILTGTPLQNNLLEYFVMVSFVKPNLLGTKKEFTNLFMNPIQNGQCANSTPVDVKVMKQRCHVLHDTLSGCVQRKDYSVLTPFLTPKHEYTLFVRLGERQRKMYQYYLDTFVCGNLSQVRARGSGMFADYQCLMKIWTHPWAVKLEAIRRLERENLENIRDFLNDCDSEPSSSEEDNGLRQDKWRSSISDSDAKKTSSDSESLQGSNDGSDDEEREGNDGQSSFRTRTNQDEESSKSYVLRRKGNAVAQVDTDSRTISLQNGKYQVSLDRDVFDIDDSEEEIAPNERGDVDKIVVVNPKEEPTRHMGSTRSGTSFKEFVEPIEEVEEKEWYDEFIEDGDDTNVELSGKLVLLLEILANAEIVGDKVLVFSQSLSSLDLIERTLGGGRIGGDTMSWCKGVDYFRLDGSTAAKSRQRYTEIFNDISNHNARLFLISTKAGSLGVNLIAANRVVVFDCSWNPSHDVQSIFRVYRFGQDKPVYVYRFISQGTMEEKIYERQINKLALAGRVVDEQQISRHFTDEEIKELYAFTAKEYSEGDDAPVPQLPADPLLAEVLQRQHPKWIVKYHEHDILLENIEDEQLTEEERRQAWASYEAQKDYASRAVERENERMRRMQALQQEQQQQQQQQQQQHHQQLMELQRRQQQQRFDSQMQQRQEILRRFGLSLQQQRPTARFPHVKLEPGQVQRPPITNEQLHRELQILSLAGVRSGLQSYRPWMPSTLHYQSAVSTVDQQRPQAIPSVVNAPAAQTYPRIVPPRSDAVVHRVPNIRIVNVGSLQRSARFPAPPRVYMPPRP